MSNILEYKGYHSKIKFDSNDCTLYGKIEGIKDLVNFQANDLNEIYNEFKAAVDDYLDFCKEIGKEPDKEYSGSFNVRIKPELHKALAQRALQENESLNKLVEKAISDYIKDSKHKENLHNTLQQIREWSSVPTVQIPIVKQNFLYPIDKNLKYNVNVSTKNN